MSKVLARFETRTGKVAAEVKEHRPGSYGWMGEYGAGSSDNLSAIKKSVLSALERRKGIRIVLITEEFGRA